MLFRFFVIYEIIYFKERASRTKGVVSIKKQEILWKSTIGFLSGTNSKYFDYQKISPLV